MNPLTHPFPAEWLTAYHDGELDADRQAQLAAHLLGCVACQQELAALDALSQALAQAPLTAALAEPADFWRGVQAQLPAQRGAAPLSARRAVLRWLPGLGLLLANGLVQAAAAAGTLIVLLVAPQMGVPAWAGWLFALGSPLGWLGWVVPAGWGGWELMLFWLVISAELAVLYLAWLGYELRYGPAATVGRTAD